MSDRQVAPLEFRIPISPVAGMYSSLRLAALSLARLGPPYSTARISVSVGDCTTHARVAADAPWAGQFPIEWRMASHLIAETWPVAASGNDRYSENARAAVVVLCDADLCVIAPFADLLARLADDRPLVAGLQAHYSPFSRHGPEANDRIWQELLASAGVTGDVLDRHYSMVPDGSQGRAPAYFNYGFVAFNPPAFRLVAPLAAKYTEVARRYLEDELHDVPAYQAQIGLSLALAVSGVEALSLGHEFNCANDDRVLETGLTNVDDIRAIHYLRGSEFDRHRFLIDPAAFAAFTRTPLRNPISERLRRHVLDLPEPCLPLPDHGETVA